MASRGQRALLLLVAACLCGCGADVPPVRPGTKLVGVLAAWRRGNERDVAMLAGALDDEDAQVRCAAAYALRDIEPEEAAGRLAGLLDDANPAVRMHAGRLLGELGAPRGVAALAAFRSDETGLARRAALTQLGGLPGPAATAAILEMVADKNRYISSEAEQVLWARRDDEAVGVRITGLRHANEDVRRACIWQLGYFGDARAVAPLVRAMREDANSLNRDYAAGALGKIGDASAAEAIVAAYKGERINGLDATNALCELGRPAAEALREILVNRELSPVARGTAGEGLGKIRDGPAIPLLIEALGAEGYSLWRMARGALQEYGDQVVPALIDAVQDNDRVAELLEEMTGEKLGPDPAAWRKWYERKQQQDKN